MNKKIIFSLFALILLIGFIGIALSAGETTTKTIDVGVTEKIGGLIGPNLDEGYVIVSGVELNENILTFLEGGNASINGIEFNNVKKDSTIKLNENGEITKADLTATADKTIFSLGGEDYEVPKGGRVVYEEGKKPIFYGKSGDSLEFKESSSEKFTTVNLLGNSLEFGKDAKGNDILTGNFEMGDNKISGLTEGGSGTVTISKDGTISEIWTGTDATMKNVDFKVTGNNLNLYYDELFNISAHKGENYFNYGIGKISAGGLGFSSDLGKANSVFGDMQTTKVTGIEAKTRDLAITLNGGTLDISRDTTNSDLAFNVNGNGEYVINDGRVAIYSQKGYVNSQNNIFVKTNYGEGSSYGLSSSYDINLNGGGYILKNNFFEDSKGSVLVDANTPWEDVAYKRIKSGMTQEEIAKIEKQTTGEGTFLDYSFAFKDELLDKELFKAAESVNIPPSFLATTVAGEGWFSRADSNSLSFWDKYEQNPNQEFLAGEISLTKIPGFFEELKKRDLLPSDSSLVHDGLFTKIKGEDVFSFVAATVKYCDSLVEEDIGKTEYNKMTDNEKFFWTTYYYNTLGSSSNYPSISIAGRRALTQKREETYAPVNAKDYITNYQNTAEYSDPMMNSKIREAMYLGLDPYFEYP